MASKCEHYNRRCALLAPCCDKIYPCRLCHNENEEHELDRKTVKTIKCLQCDNLQEVSSHCEECSVKFGRYFCNICRLFDDTEKGQFHCNECGICRVGGKDNYFHCSRCDVCLGTSLKETHKCVDKSSRAACPICYEDLHTSRIPAHVPSCGHLIHTTCFSEYLKSGGYACPTCNTTMIDMVPMWRRLDNEIAHTPMPEEYANYMITVLCRDCHTESKVKFHVLGLKCLQCNSYNTSQEKEEGLERVVAQAAAQDNAAGGDEDEWTTEEEEEIVGGENEPQNEAGREEPGAARGNGLHDVGGLVDALDLDEVELHEAPNENDLPID